MPSQFPTIFAAYSDSATGFGGLQDETPKASATSRPSGLKMKLVFMEIFFIRFLVDTSTTTAARFATRVSSLSKAKIGFQSFFMLMTAQPS